MTAGGGESGARKRRGDLGEERGKAKAAGKYITSTTVVLLLYLPT